jgi:hypothetical protein
MSTTKKAGRPRLPKAARRVFIGARVSPEAFQVLRDSPKLKKEGLGQLLSDIIVSSNHNKALTNIP